MLRRGTLEKYSWERVSNGDVEKLVVNMPILSVISAASIDAELEVRQNRDRLQPTTCFCSVFTLRS